MGAPENDSRGSGDISKENELHYIFWNDRILHLTNNYDAHKVIEITNFWNYTSYNIMDPNILVYSIIILIA